MRPRTLWPSVNRMEICHAARSFGLCGAEVLRQPVAESGRACPSNQTAQTPKAEG
jgi:hypothetical protein